MSKIISYIRVSTTDQNLQRQRDEMVELGIEEKYIYEDKQSGKDFERIGYKYMKKTIEQGDTLVIKSLDRLGCNQKEVRKEWEWFKDNKINIRVLDMPVLNREYKDENEIDKSLNELIRNLVFEIISWTDEETRKRIKTSQREGIEAAKKKDILIKDHLKNLKKITKRHISTKIKHFKLYYIGTDVYTLRNRKHF